MTLTKRPLLVAESGSRAWGFSGVDSDWDIRGIYALPFDTYLRLWEPTDNWRYQDEALKLDLSMWDVRKALRLHAQGNVQPWEWTHSPITYYGSSKWYVGMAQLGPPNVTRAHAHHVGLAMGRSGFGDAKCGAPGKVKKWLYGLRSLACARYAHLHGHANVPVNFLAVINEVVPIAFINEIQDLVAAARTSSQLALPLSPGLWNWVVAALEEEATSRGKLGVKKEILDPETYNEVFRYLIDE